MIHYIDVSGSMRDEDLVQVAQIVVNRVRIGDSIYAIAYDAEKLSLTQNLEYQLLHTRVRSSGFLLSRYSGLLMDNRKLDVNDTFYTDIVFNSSADYIDINFRFQNTFVVPACPVCFCSCPRNLEYHIKKTLDVANSVYLIHND